MGGLESHWAAEGRLALEGSCTLELSCLMQLHLEHVSSSSTPKPAMCIRVRLDR